jgi:hypothetical protein
MKLFSELQIRDHVTLYCSYCNKLSEMQYIYFSNNEQQFRCKKCKRLMNIPLKDTVKAEKDVETEYKLQKDYKIGHRLFHTVFNEKGDVVGKKGDCIYVKFDKGGLKKLVVNYAG